MLLALNSPAALLLPYALPPPSYPICREAGQEGRNRTESSIFCGSMRGHLGTSVLAAAAVLLSTSMPGVKAADCCTGTSAQGCISDVTFWGHPDPCSSDGGAAPSPSPAPKLMVSSYTAVSSDPMFGNAIAVFNRMVGKSSTSSDSYFVWCNMLGCPQFNIFHAEWCSAGGSGACGNQCAAKTPADGGKNNVCLRHGPNVLVSTSTSGYTRDCDICVDFGFLGNICSATGTEHVCYTGCGCTQCT